MMQPVSIIFKRFAVVKEFYCSRTFCTSQKVKTKTNSQRFVTKKRVELSKLLYNMQNPEIETVLRPLRESVKEQVNTFSTIF